MKYDSIMATEIKKEIADNVSISPQWLRIKSAIAYSGLCRSKLYELIKNGNIKSICLRNKGAVRGTRLVSVVSIDNFLNSIG